MNILNIIINMVIKNMIDNNGKRKLKSKSFQTIKTNFLDITTHEPLVLNMFHTGWTERKIKKLLMYSYYHSEDYGRLTIIIMPGYEYRIQYNMGDYSASLENLYDENNGTSC